MLSPTHEEEITEIVAKTVKSYKELPLRLYQICSCILWPFCYMNAHKIQHANTGMNVVRGKAYSVHASSS